VCAAFKFLKRPFGLSSDYRTIVRGNYPDYSGNLPLHTVLPHSARFAAFLYYNKNPRLASGFFNFS